MPPTHTIRTIAALLIAGLLAACSNTQRPPTREELDDAEKPDEWREREAQSDFLDTGKWLSFVQNDQREYPEYFEGLDRDQKRRLRLAPKEDATNRVLLEFNLPKGSKIWPVDWYGTELMAIDLPDDGDTTQYSVALKDEDDSGGPRHSTETGPADITPFAIAKRRTQSSGSTSDPVTHPNPKGDDNNSGAVFVAGKDWTYGYAAKRIIGRTGSWLVVVEVRSKAAAKGVAPSNASKPLFDILSGISIKRELALEGSPKHKCSSSMDELLRGTLHFPGGTLNLPLTDGYIARKIGGDSTVQIDGEGASPWLLLRRLEPSSTPGGLKQQVRADTTFKRRRDVSSARFEAGRLLKASLPLVVFDYRETGAEQQVLGLIAFGTELFTIEINSKGVIDGDSRREARDKALALLQSATGTGTDRSLQQLEGWKPSE